MKTLLVFVLMLLASVAHAAPPENGWYGAFRLPFVICDTKEQILEIFAAGQEEPDGGAKAKFSEYYAQKNERGEFVCAIANMGMVAVGESIPLGIHNHTVRNHYQAWAVHIGNSTAGYWMLYMENLEGEEI